MATLKKGQIISARWGLGNSWVDVTKRFRQILISGLPTIANPIGLRLNSSDPPLDPFPGMQKHLHIRLAGYAEEYCIKEGCPIELELVNPAEQEDVVETRPAYSGDHQNPATTNPQPKTSNAPLCGFSLIFAPSESTKIVGGLPRQMAYTPLIIYLPPSMPQIKAMPSLTVADISTAIASEYESTGQTISDATTEMVGEWSDRFSRAAFVTCRNLASSRELAKQGNLVFSPNISKNKILGDVAKFMGEAIEFGNLVYAVGIKIGADVKALEDFLMDPLRVETTQKAAIESAVRVKIRYAANPVTFTNGPRQDENKPKVRRPVPNKIAMTAWRIWIATGWNQKDIAEALSKETSRSITQGAVSRYIKIVKEYRDAGNSLPELPKLGKTIAVDPLDLDMGKRTNPLTPRQRPKTTDES